MENENLLDVIIHYGIKLQEAGAYLKGDCPFCKQCPTCHKPQSSFVVSPNQNSFYCFSCKTAGSVKEFIKGINNEQTKKD